LVRPRERDPGKPLTDGKSADQDDKDGRWSYQGEEITHRPGPICFTLGISPGMNRVGSSSASGGRNARWRRKTPPFVVATMDFVSAGPRDEEAIWLTLNDETREKMAPDTLRIGPNHIPYCRVREGMFEARFSRNAYQILASHIQLDEKENRFFLALNGKNHYLGQKNHNNA